MNYFIQSDECFVVCLYSMVLHILDCSQIVLFQFENVR